MRRPVALFEMPLIGVVEANYDVSSIGRFLVNVPSREQSSLPITVILNWASGLKK